MLGEGCALLVVTEQSISNILTPNWAPNVGVVEEIVVKVRKIKLS